MRILILGAFNAGALENYYFKGLQKAGATCSSFDIAQDYYSAIGHSFWNKVLNKINISFFLQKINRDLLQFLSDKQFDVILVFKGLTLYASTIEKLKGHGKILCCYNPDHPFKFYSTGSGNKHIVNSIGQYDLYFTYSEMIAAQLKSHWKKESYTIPFGYDDDDDSDYASSISVYKKKILFIGAWDRGRMDTLSQVRGVDLNIYGDSKWATQQGRNRFIAAAFQGRSLYDREYKEATRNAIGMINLLRRQNIEEGSHNMRSFEVPGYGGLLIANRTAEQSLFFEEDKEAIFFESIEELNDKLVFLTRNEAMVAKIKEAGKRRSELCGYGYSHRCKQLYQILQTHL